MRLNLISIPWSSSPFLDALTVAEAKLFLRVTGTDQDAVIQQMIAQARDWAEGFINRALVDTTAEIVLDAFPADYIELPLGRTLAVQSVSYTDTDGVHVLQGPSSSPIGTAYREDLTSIHGGRIYPVDAWPAIDQAAPAPVRVRFRAGYGSNAAAIAPGIIAGIQARLADLYEGRGQEAARVAEFYLRPFALRKC